MVTQKVLDLIANHPVITAIDRGEPVTDLQLIELERTLREELGNPPLELSEENIRRAYRMQVSSMLEFLRNLLELDGIPDYEEIVKRQFSLFLAARPSTVTRYAFLRGVQQVILQKRRLHWLIFTSRPWTDFGADAVDIGFVRNRSPKSWASRKLWRYNAAHQYHHRSCIAHRYQTPLASRSTLG